MSNAFAPASGLRVAIVCEGQTEEAFVNTVLAPAFYTHRMVLYPLIIPTSLGHRGGGLLYRRVQRYLYNLLRGESPPFVTTLFDLYALDTNFPDFGESIGRPVNQRIDILTTAFHSDIVSQTGCRPDRFIPYFQAYEYEALLFSDIPTLTALEPNWAVAMPILQSVRDAAESPEHINDGPTTKPAARLKHHLINPTYRKTLHGPIAAELIGLSKIAVECPLFAEWLTSLRRLAPPTLISTIP